jgi:hypothetical protein
MPNEELTPMLRDYYKRFFTALATELRKAVFEAVIAIVAIIVVLFFQFYFGWIKREETLSSALINIAPSAAILLAYALRHFIRTPWLLDVERQGEINRSNKTLTELQTSLDSLTSALTRPKFAIAKVSVDTYGEFDEDDRYKLKFDVTNTGSHPADELIWRVVTVDEDAADKSPSFKDSSMTNEIPINQPFDMEFGFRAGLRQKSMIIVFCLKYTDVLTKREYRQTFFHKWVKPGFGVIGPDVRHLTIEEREAAQERLKEQLSGFI